MTTALPNGASLEDLRWLQRVAVRLAGDADLADDLVQDTLVEAWRDPPSERVSSLRPWLSRVLRNRFLMRLRSQRRRAARHEHADAPRELPLPDVEQARLDVLAALLGELRMLPASDQQLIVRRYIDEDTAESIARDLDMPAATVRTRVRRALARLREGLDRRFGDRRTWCAAVGALPGGMAPPPIATPIPESSTTMSITAKVLLTAATSAATFAGWAALRSPASNPGASAAPSSVATSAAEPETKTSAAATRDRWERSRAEIRSVLPPPRSAPPTPPPTKNHPELENQAFRELLRACIDDLESETTGALTLSIREIGAPDVGTIYESVTVLYTNFDDPEILECLTQSMYGYIGPAPDEPFERAFSRTLPLGAAKDDDARIHQMIGGIVGSHIREIRYCETLGDGEAQGEIALTMAVGEDRRAKVEVVDSELPKPVVDCILTAARRWVFPELLAGKTFDHAFALPMPSEDPAP